MISNCCEHLDWGCPGRDRAIREELEFFVRQMERKLKENDHKSGWTGDQFTCIDATHRLIQEAYELYEAIFDKRPDNEIIAEASDVANFAMMIADRKRKGLE